MGKIKNPNIEILSLAVDKLGDLTHKMVFVGGCATGLLVLGFRNKWYTPAIKHAELIQLPSEQDIQIISAPYFLITKLEAYDGRGNNDYQMSHDMEDLIAVLDGRSELVGEVKKSDTALIKELSRRFTLLLNDSRFVDAVSGHIPTDQFSQARVPTILKTLREIANPS